MRYYGKRASCPNGISEDRRLCVVEVWPSTGDILYPHQCFRKRCAGPNGMFCRQHANLFAVGTLSQRDIPRDEP